MFVTLYIYRATSESTTYDSHIPSLAPSTRSRVHPPHKRETTRQKRQTEEERKEQAKNEQTVYPLSRTTPSLIVATPVLLRSSKTASAKASLPKRSLIAAFLGLLFGFLASSETFPTLRPVGSVSLPSPFPFPAFLEKMLSCLSALFAPPTRARVCPFPFPFQGRGCEYMSA